MTPWVPILAPCFSHGLLASSPRGATSYRIQMVLHVLPSQEGPLARTLRELCAALGSGTTADLLLPQDSSW